MPRRGPTTTPSPRRGRWRRAAGGLAAGAAGRLAAWAVAAALGGCITTYEDAPLFGPPAKSTPVSLASVSIPFPELEQGEDPVARAVYEGLLKRMQDAVGRADRADLATLLALAERPDQPVWLQERLAGYRLAERGLLFRDHLRSNAKLEMTAADASASSATAALPLGAPLRCDLVVPPVDPPFRLGAADEDQRIGFLVAVAVEDAFVDGSTRDSSTNRLLCLPQAVVLDRELRVPIALDFPAGDAIHRTLSLRIDLVPGYVGVDGRSAPVQGGAIAASRVECYPIGYELVAGAPLEHLRAALQRGDRASFATVYLAATATKGAEREPAIAALIEQVRLGRPDLAIVAMAALRAMTGVEVSIGDREGWLAWWQAR